MKRRTVFLILFVITVTLTLAVLAILNNPKRALFKKTGIEAGDNIAIAKYSFYLDFAGFYLVHACQIDFEQEQYDLVMGKLNAVADISESDSEINSITEAAERGCIPYKKGWMDAERETVLCGSYYELAEVPLAVVSQDESGTYHAYLEWDWSPFQFLTK